jgi:glycerol-3-phosphate acyltransferase PlsY
VELQQLARDKAATGRQKEGWLSETQRLAIAFIGSYLVGSVPTAVLVAKSQGVDIYRVGSGNPGASNISRALGKGWAIFVFAVDAAKGAVPVALAYWVLGLSKSAATLCGLAAVVGHSWPVTARFKGGRGVATGAGVVAVVLPEAALAGVAVWGAVARLSRKASIASLLALLVVLGLAWLLGKDLRTAGALSAIGAVVVLRHLPNIKRILRGEELTLESQPAVSSNIRETDSSRRAEILEGGSDVR